MIGGQIWIMFPLVSSGSCDADMQQWTCPSPTHCPLNTWRPTQNGRRFADDVFKCIFLNANVCISFKISLKFVPRVPINNIPVLVQIMAWRRPGDKPLSEPMMVSLLIHICVTRPQWVKIAEPIIRHWSILMHPNLLKMHIDFSSKLVLRPYHILHISQLTPSASICV